MSTGEQEMLVETALESLLTEIAKDFLADDNNNKVSDLEPPRTIEAAQEAAKKLGTVTLRETHTTVLISLEQMLDYVEKVRKPMKAGDVKNLLQIYLDMARSYYTQYERSLVQDIQEQYKIAKESKIAIERIQELKDQEPNLTAVIEPLEKIRGVAAAEYEKLLGNFPTLLQSALDKLRDEWQRLGTIAVASQALTKDKGLVGFLEAVVNVASHSIGIETERIVVVPGREFALHFFKYIDDVAVLAVPIYSVQAPWEWSIFWHELAGYKVRRLKQDTTLETIRKTLRDRRELLKNITWDWVNPFSKKYLQELFSEDDPDLSDLGDFEHQFERMLANLPKKNKIQLYQQIKDQGWSVDWIEELFEDAWSVLAIGKVFLDFFEDVLRRHAVRDDRHPPLDVRIQVAKELLILMNPDDPDVEKYSSKTPESIVAQQILKFVSLLIAATRKFEKDGEDVYKLQGNRDQFFIGMGEEIQAAISAWSGGFSREDDYLMHHTIADRAGIYAKRFIKRFSADDAKEAVTELFAAFASYNEKNQIEPNNKFFDALKATNYKQLIDISFYDVDYHTPGDIGLSESGQTYWVKPTDWNSQLWRAQRHTPVNDTVINTQTIVTEVISGAHWVVNKTDWSSWSKMTQ